MAKRQQKPAGTPPAPITAREPRTGVGAFDEHAEPAGIALGGDTGDVNIPHTGHVPPGETGSATDMPEWSTVWRDPHAPEQRRKAG